jgi:hypothetical protein
MLRSFVRIALWTVGVCVYVYGALTALFCMYTQGVAMPWHAPLAWIGLLWVALLLVGLIRFTAEGADGVGFFLIAAGLTLGTLWASISWALDPEAWFFLVWGPWSLLFWIVVIGKEYLRVQRAL